jgi:hypothetical protein
LIFLALIDDPSAVNDPPQFFRIGVQLVTATIHKASVCILTLLSATLVACGDGHNSDGAGGSGNNGGNPPTYTIGGAATGLQGTGLKLRNGATDLSIAGNDTFVFPGNFAAGTTYNVTVVAQPTAPAQVCSVTGGAGTVATSNVTNIAVACTTTAVAHTVGGVISGLTGSGLKLNDGTEDLIATANGAFKFPTSLTSESAYTVTVVAQPHGPDQICTVSGGSGTVGTSDISNVMIACATSPLSLTSSTPANSATDISRTFVPVLNFSASLDDTTVTTSSVTLTTAAGVSQTITAQVSSLNEITVTPATKLAPLTAYTLTVSTDVRGTRGEQLTAPASVTFTTSDKAWQTAAAIENNNGNATAPQIAANANGNAVAVWMQAEGAITRIWSSYYTPGTGWSTAVPIETDTTNNSSSPQVAIDSQGKALAVWVQTFSNGLSYLQANQYTPGGWQPGAVMQIETDNAGNASDPQIAFDAGGNALVTWTRNQNKIWAIRRPAGGAWEHESQIEPDNGATIAAKPQIALNASGNAWVVWVENYLNGQYVMANRYTAGTGWGTAGMVSANVYEVSASQIAIDANGDGLAVWEQYGGGAGSTDILSSRFTAGTGWSAAHSITTDKSHDSKTPKVVFDSKGNALAVWAGTGAGAAIWSSRFSSADTDWEAAAPIGTVNQYATVETPQIAFDASGNAYAVWRQFISGKDKQYNIASSRLAAGGAWTAPELTESDDAGGAEFPQIAVDANGNATAVWQQSDGTRDNIVVNRFE